jgi:hypothetical protein
LEYQKGYSVRFHPPLARLAERVSFAQAALRSHCAGKDAASGTLASKAKRPSTICACFHEGRGPPIKGALRFGPQTSAPRSTWDVSSPFHLEDFHKAHETGNPLPLEYQAGGADGP